MTLKLQSRFDKLNVQRDCYVVTDKEPAGFKDCIPSEPEVSSVDSCCGGKPDSRIAPWVLLWRAWLFNIKNYGSRCSVNREVTLDGQLPVRFLPDGSR